MMAYLEDTEAGGQAQPRSVEGAGDDEQGAGSDNPPGACAG